MDPVTGTISNAMIKRVIGAATSKFGAALGPPFESELQTILRGVRDIKTWLETDRRALLLDGFSFILQNDLDSARKSLTQAMNREPRSAVVRFWLALVLSWQGRDGGVAEMRNALELNPFVTPPPLLPFLERESDAQVTPRIHWSKPLAGSSPGVTYGALGGSAALHPSRWAVGRLASKVSPGLDGAIFSDHYLFSDRHSSVLAVSLGATHPVVHWVPQPYSAPAPTFLSMFDALTGEAKWHRLISSWSRVRLVTPSMVALQFADDPEITVLSAVSGQPVTANIREDYFIALFHPNYAGDSDLFRASHADSQYRDLSIPNAKAMSRYRKHLPPDETLVVRDPFGQRLIAEATNKGLRITAYHRHLYSTSELRVTC
jgi:hypothetical protein